MHNRNVFAYPIIHKFRNKYEILFMLFASILISFHFTSSYFTGEIINETRIPLYSYISRNERTFQKAQRSHFLALFAEREYLTRLSCLRARYLILRLCIPLQTICKGKRESSTKQQASITIAH